MNKIGKIGALVLIGLLISLVLTQSWVAPSDPEWSTGGNSADSTDFLGTTNDEDLRIKTNSAQVMVIESGGNIGIGTTGPDRKLDVLDSSNPQLRLTQADGSVYTDLQTDSNGYLIIDPSGDRVGIGTSSPGYVLDIKASSSIGPPEFTGDGITDMVVVGTFTGATALTYKVMIDTEGTPDTFNWSDDGGSTWDETGVAITGAEQTLNNGITIIFSSTSGYTAGDYWLFTTTVTNPFSVQNAAGVQSFYVDNDGKVYFNNTNSEYALEVKGDVWFNSSIVKFGNNSLKAMGEHFKITSNKYFRIIFDDNDEAADYFFAVGVHEDHEKDTPAYATNERFWIREDGKTGIGAQSPLGRLWVNTEPVTGTGSIILSSGTTVTGSGTSFTSELKVGDEIWIEISHGPKPYDQQKNIRRVVTITSDTSLEVDRPFTIWVKQTKEEVQKDITSPTSFKYTRPILCVETNERVGISTISPTEKLDVNGRVRVRDLPLSNPEDKIVVANSTGVLHDSNKTIGDLIDHDWHEVGTSNPPDNINDDIFTHGNVSIGIATPNHKLHISDTDATANRAGLYLIQTGAMNGTGYGIYVNKTGASTTNVAGYFSATGATNNYGLIVENGDVGIGTVAPTEKLDVNGKVRVRNLPTGSSSSDKIVVADSTGVLHESTKTIDDLIDHDWYESGGTPPDSINDDIYTQGDVGIGILIPNHKLHISDADTTANRAGLYVTQSGAITGTGYGIYSTKTGASTTNVAGYFSATGATNNYGLIVENGDVGIGTLAPTEKLDVNGKARVRNLPAGSSTDNIVVADSTGVLHESNKTVDDLLDHDWYESGNTPPNSINDDIYTYGSVGIGTNSPSRMVHIFGGSLLINQTNQNTANIILRNSVDEDAVILNDQDDGTLCLASTGPRGDLRFYAGGSGEAFERMRIDSDGHVGIGEMDPETELHVEGVVTLDASATPDDPTSSVQARIYIRNGNFIIQYNDGGTTRYKYLDLTGTGVTWTHTTTAP